MILGEIVGAVLALLYRGRIESELIESMEEQIRDDYKNATAEYDAWNYMQTRVRAAKGLRGVRGLI